MKKVILLFVVSFFGFAQQLKVAEIQILVTGPMEVTDVHPKTGERWMGLFEMPDGYELKETSIKVKYRSNQPTMEVSIKDSIKPMILIRPTERISESKVTTVPSDHRDLKPGNNVILKLGKITYTLIVSGVSEGSGYSNYKIFLVYGKVKQLLVNRARAVSGGLPSIMWCGDLDNDGKLDLLLDLRWDYVVNVPTLFLSSSSEGKIVDRVATCHPLGC
jgi:hypothetical protein